jgi:hypothetical protein
MTLLCRWKKLQKNGHKGLHLLAELSK